MPRRERRFALTGAQVAAEGTGGMQDEDAPAGGPITAPVAILTVLSAPTPISLR